MKKINSPNRKAHNWHGPSMHSYYDLPPLTMHEFEQIEKHSRLKLTPSIREEIQNAINHYCVLLSGEKNSQTREDVFQNLKSINNNLLQLKDWLSKDDIPNSYIFYETFKLEADTCFGKFDWDGFIYDLAKAYTITDKAIESLNNEIAYNDKGGKYLSPASILKSRLYKILEKIDDSRGKGEGFIFAVNNVLAYPFKMELDVKPGSLDRAERRNKSKK